jgi:hypothetical protein
MFGQPRPLIQSLHTVLDEKPPTVTSKMVRTSVEIKKIMYVGTAFHGEGARLRPIFHDLTYIDWQIKLLSHLKKINIDVIYKPHPEGATRAPKDFAEKFGFRTIEKKFEDINETFDAYLIDFLFSSTTPSILKSDKPVFFINLGFPEIIPNALELVRKRCYYLDAEYSTDSRLSIDFDKFNESIKKKEHIFDTSFSDLYFDNIS